LKEGLAPLATLDTALAHAARLLAENRFQELVQLASPLEKAWTAKSSGIPREAPLLLYGLATAYRGLGLQDAALATALHGVNMAMDQGNRDSIYLLTSNIADIYFEKHDLASAIKFCKDSLAVLASAHLQSAEKDGRSPRVEDLRLMLQLGGYLTAAKQWEQANTFLLAALEVAEAHRDFATTANILDRLGQIATAEGNHASAKQFALSAKQARAIMPKATTPGDTTKADVRKSK
jgi:uncharacterized protein HemY